jgi:hypothetical protein
MSFWLTDTLRNFVTGLGQVGIDSSKSTTYDLSLLNRNILENMYRGDWLARKICDAPAEDITREWRSWQANQDQIKALETVERTMDLQRKVKQWISRARLYGGSALVIGVDDGNDPSQEIDLERCGKGCLKYVVVLHRYELNAGPRIYNVADPYYTRAAYYTVATPMFGFHGEPGQTSPGFAPAPGALNQPARGALNQPARGALNQPPPTTPNSPWFTNVTPLRGKSEQERRNLQTVPTNLGLTQIHPSRVLELPGNELPDWRLAPLGGGWGDSVLQTVVDTMVSFTGTLSSIAAMVNDGKLDVIKIQDMSLNLTSPGYKDKLLSRFALATQTKSAISALLLDKDEEWQRVQTQYSGLPMILHEFITVVSAAADIPVSRLFGQAMGRGMQGGSTSGGPDDLRNYYDTCVDQQKNEIAPRLGMLDQVMQRSALGTFDENIHYKWNPLWQLSDGDKAAIGYQKAQTTQIYSTLGIVNEDALREGVVNQLIEDGVYPGLSDAISQYGMEPEEPEEPEEAPPPPPHQEPGEGGDQPEIQRYRMGP